MIAMKAKGSIIPDQFNSFNKISQTENVPIIEACRDIAKIIFQMEKGYLRNGVVSSK